MKTRVAALVALLSASCCPPFIERAPPFSNYEAQKRAVSEIRLVGHALASYLTDRLSAVPTERSTILVSTDGQPPILWRDCPVISVVDLRKELVPQYIKWVPDRDPWGRPYEYCLSREFLPTGGVNYGHIGIRSAGRDHVFQGDIYSMGPFDAADFDQDIVWFDSSLVRWPQQFPST